MNISVAIVTWNGQSHIERCLHALLEQKRSPDSVCIVDNASTDSTVATVKALDSLFKLRGSQLVLLQNKENVGFTQAANQVLKHILTEARAEVIVLLNQDTYVDRDWLCAIEDAFLRHPRAGAVGCKIFYPDKAKLQHAGGFLEMPRMICGHYGHHQCDEGIYDYEREVDFVTGAAMAIRVEALRQIGLFNEIFSPGYYEDVDLCLRLRATGWRVIYIPSAKLIHAESASFLDWKERWALSHRNRVLFAMQSMRDPLFRSEFERAEQLFLETRAARDELKVLKLAYGRALLAIALAPKYLLSGAASDSDELRAIVDTLTRLRQCCIKLSYS